MTNILIYLKCDECGKEYGEADDENVDFLRELAREDGWEYKKVENGSKWDFCPKCATKDNPSIFPQYVFMEEGENSRAALRKDGTNTYYRDAGAWDVVVKRQKDGSLRTTENYHEGLSNKEVVECTEEEWRKDNGKYC